MPAEKSTSKPKKTTVRKNTKKTEAKPVKEKECSVVECSASVDCACKILKETLLVWLDGWKKIFTLRGRSSRFELWGFLLVNTIIFSMLDVICGLILSPYFLRVANEVGYSVTLIEKFIITARTIFYITLVLPLFPIGSMLIRRMHDLNKLAWRGYLEPVFMGSIALSMIHYAIVSLSETDLAYTMLMLGIALIAIIYSVGFYSIKFLIMTMFYRGDAKRNSYGDVCHNSDCHEEMALNYSCYFFLFIATIILFYILLF